MKLNKVFVIHYTRLKERRKKVLEIFKNIPIQYEFIEEYDKDDFTKEIVDQFYKADKDMFEHKIETAFNPPEWDLRENWFRVLNDAEISCTIKHICALKKVSEQEDDFCLVVEDDILPSFENPFDKIDLIIEQAPKDWDAIFLGQGCGYDFISSKIDNLKQISDNLFYVPPPSTNCAEAYLIKKDTAKKIYESIIPFQLVSDWELAYQFYKLNMNVYWSLPSLFYQGSKSGDYNSTLR
jgi:GR25 family glycosyltransferase involved in LPS biosynthesis